MPLDTHVVYVHGICRHDPGYSDAWWDVLKQYLPGVPDANRHEVLWSDLIEAGPPIPETARAERRTAEALALARPAPASGRDAIAAQIKDVLADRAGRQYVAATLQTTVQGVPPEGTAAIRAVPTLVGPQAFFNIPGLECIDDFVAYLLDPNTRSQVMDRFNQVVQPLLQAGLRVQVISHSWGTVVAYEALRGMDAATQFSDSSIGTLFTVGSALAIAPVRRLLLPTAIDGRRPRVVETWVNLNAHFDIVGGHLRDNPFQVDAEYLELPPVGCSSIIPEPACAHGSYFNPGNIAVNRDIVASYILGGTGEVHVAEPGQPSFGMQPEPTSPIRIEGEAAMAKRDSSRETRSHAAEPGATAASPNPAPLIQYDPRAPATRVAAVQVQASADTIHPLDDWKRARDELERKLGGHRGRATAFATAMPDTAGRENILGFGVGMRYASSSLTGHLAVKVFVREKLPMERVATPARIPRQVAGFDTDVEAIGEVILHNYAKFYTRPVPCGVTISNIDLPGSGTLGCLVALNNGKLCILSNNHVLANENSAAIGSSIIQPGRAEPGDPPNQIIGTLENFIPIQATGNLVDAAVALTSFDMVSPKHVTYQLSPEILQATIGMTVIKDGRTTQSTVGMITDLHVNITVGYDPFPDGAEMRDQIAIRGVQGPFSMPGDSGSLIVTAGTKQPIGLLFAGSSDNRMTFANPILAVKTALGIDRFVAEPPPQ